LLEDRIGQVLASADRRKNKVALLYLDLDGFKLINDTKGHAVGDKLLKLVSERLISCVRECDTVSRVGGDEFVVLLADIAGPESAGATTNRILSSLNLPHALDGFELTADTCRAVRVSALGQKRLVQFEHRRVRSSLEPV